MATATTWGATDHLPMLVSSPSLHPILLSLLLLPLLPPTHPLAPAAAAPRPWPPHPPPPQCPQPIPRHILGPTVCWCLHQPPPHQPPKRWRCALPRLRAPPFAPSTPATLPAARRATAHLVVAPPHTATPKPFPCHPPAWSADVCTPRPTPGACATAANPSALFVTVYIP